MAKQSTQQQVTLLSDASVGNILLGIRDNFTGQLERTKLKGIINYAKEAALAKQIIAKDTRLQSATETSISNSFMNIAFVGLSLNPVKQHVTFIARWNDKIKRYECSISIMYRGLMWLAGQAGVTDIDVDVVYSADRFKIIKTADGSNFEHEIAHSVPRDDDHVGNEGRLIANKFQGSYVAARMPGSKIRKVEWVPAEHIYVVRSKSESYLKEGEPNPKSPWVWSFDEMAKKVVIKIAQKRWEEAVVENEEWKRFQAAVALDNVAEGVIPARESDIPGTATHVHTADDPPPPEVVKLSMAQLTEIEKLVEVVAPNREDAPNNVSHYMSKVARTYRENTLAAVDASKFDEIKKRIENAIQVQKDKKAADPKTGQQKAGEGKGDAGKQQDAAKKGTEKPAADKQAKGDKGSKGGEGDQPAGGGEREPGSDDDYGGPDNDGPADPNAR